MGFGPTTDESEELENSKVIKAKHIDAVNDAFERHINTGIRRPELANIRSTDGHRTYIHDGFIESRNIFKPEFYGSPSPRMMAVSGQTHFRESPDSFSDAQIFHANLTGRSTTIPGTCTTIKLPHRARVNVMASFYCFEIGGINFPAGFSRDKGGTNGGYENRIVGFVNLSVRGVVRGATLRKIYTSNVGCRGITYADDTSLETDGAWVANGFIEFPMIGRHQHSITFQTTLQKGIHDIGLVYRTVRQTEEDYEVKINDPIEVKRHGFTSEDRPYLDNKKFVVFKARNLIVDAYYTDKD